MVEEQFLVPSQPVSRFVKTSFPFTLVLKRRNKTTDSFSEIIRGPEDRVSKMIPLLWLVLEPLPRINLLKFK